MHIDPSHAHTPSRLALKDIRASFINISLWWHLSWTELRRNYSSTFFGPFWASISAGIVITALGIVYAKLWQRDINSYLPFLCASYLTWNMISLTLTEACNIYINAAATLKEIPLHLTLFAIHTVFRNIINYAHCMVVFLIIAVLLPVKINAYSLLFFPNLLLVSLNLTWAVLLIGALCARYRDFKPIMASILQISFFITPVIWEASRLKDKAFVMFVRFNPFYHAVNSIRNPLLGLPVEPLNYFFLMIMLVVGWILAWAILTRIRTRLIFWV